MKHLLLLIGLLSTTLNAQTQLDLGRTESDTYSEILDIDPAHLRNYIYEDIPSHYKEEILDRSAIRFADQSAYFAANLLRSGVIYNGWKQVDNYLNAILHKLIPAELSGREYLRAYLVKDGNYGAFMTPSGQLFVHIGVFDEIKSEATLAGIIAHEIAHYSLHHSIEGFVKQRTGEFDEGFFIKNEGAASRYSVANELAADSLAVVYLRAAGYTAQGLIDAFEIHLQLEEKWLMKQKYEWEVSETTHPTSEKRMAAIQEEVKGEGREAVVSKAAFAHLKKMAIPEVLKQLLHEGDYANCLEKAFKYHLYDPNNPTYLYYLMEAIRRSAYLNNQLWKEKFIVDRYYEVVEEKGEKRKEAIRTHLFDGFRPLLMGLQEEDFADLQAQFYWEGEPKFTTYEEAFQFFFQIGELIEAPEAYLSNALSLSFNEEKCNLYLEKYLTFENIRYREFAEQLLAKEIITSLPDRKMTVYSEFYTFIRQGKDGLLVWQGLHEQEDHLKTLASEVVSSFPNRRFESLKALKKEHFNDFLKLSELERISMTVLLSIGQPTRLYILDPAYWETLRAFGVNEIEFINCIYRDVVKADNSAEGYLSVANSRYDDYLSKDKGTGRHLNIILSSVMIKDSDEMKRRYYDGEDRLPIKGVGYDHVRTLLNSKLADADKEE